MFPMNKVRNMYPMQNMFPMNTDQCMFPMYKEQCMFPMAKEQCMFPVDKVQYKFPMEYMLPTHKVQFPKDNVLQIFLTQYTFLMDEVTVYVRNGMVQWYSPVQKVQIKSSQIQDFLKQEQYIFFQFFSVCIKRA